MHLIWVNTESTVGYMIRHTKNQLLYPALKVAKISSSQSIRGVYGASLVVG